MLTVEFKEASNPMLVAIACAGELRFRTSRIARNQKPGLLATRVRRCSIPSTKSASTRKSEK